MIIRREFALIAGLVYAAVCSAGPAVADALKPEVRWKDPSEVQLEVDFPGQGYRADWQLFRCECGDLLIRTELREPGETVHGDIALVGNRAVLTRGFDEEAAELVSVDAPALMMQLALRLLERVEPGGPAAISERRAVAVEDSVNFINLDTGAAVGGFPAPWSVEGSLWPAGDTVRRFDLKFVFNTGGVAGADAEQGEMRLAGSAEFARKDFPLGAALSLKNWSLNWRDPRDPLADDGDTPQTLGDLRRLIQKTARQSE